MSTDNPPLLHVEPLAYSMPMEDPWRIMIKLATTLAIAFAALHLFAAACQFLLSWLGGVNFGYRLFSGEWRDTIMVSIELMDDACAAGMLIGALGVRAMHEWGRPTLIWSARLLMAVWVALLLFPLFPMMTMGAPFTRGGGVVSMVVYFAYACGGLFLRALIPLTIVWIMRRPEVRDRLMGRVVV